MYFIERGTCHITVDDKPGEIQAIRTVGDYFGEMGVLTDIKRSASVRAATCCNIAAIGKEYFEYYFSEFPGCALAIYRNIIESEFYEFRHEEKKQIDEKCAEYAKHFRKLKLSQAQSHIYERLKRRKIRKMTQPSTFDLQRQFSGYSEPRSLSHPSEHNLTQ